jgi:hypothetical protein
MRVIVELSGGVAKIALKSRRLPIKGVRRVVCVPDKGDTRYKDPGDDTGLPSKLVV